MEIDINSLFPGRHVWQKGVRDDSDGKSVDSVTLTKKTRARPMAIRAREGRWDKEERKKKREKKTLRYGYAPQAGAAVNNETLHQLAKILAVFSLREVELSRRIQRFLTQQRGRARFYGICERARLPRSSASLRSSYTIAAPAISRNALLFYRPLFRAAFPPASRPNRAQAVAEPERRCASLAHASFRSREFETSVFPRERAN